MDNRGLILLRNLLGELRTTIKEIGSCDHSVGHCVCDLIHLADETDQYIIDICTQKCPICDEIILLDESYIQNCDGVQHLDCYLKPIV